ncbi:hypothetical protein BGP_5946 [Beggiatoa sp. PS]|nr:hypothetical protein BGP_5946 [Beggiatoa sp. PS]
MLSFNIIIAKDILTIVFIKFILTMSHLLIKMIILVQQSYAYALDSKIPAWSPKFLSHLKTDVTHYASQTYHFDLRCEICFLRLTVASSVTSFLASLEMTSFVSIFEALCVTSVKNTIS